jgi:hypothetical protein
LSGDFGGVSAPPLPGSPELSGLDSDFHDGCGAVIGGIIGGAVGTQRAVQTKDRDVVLPAGTGITVTLDQKYTAAG